MTAQASVELHLPDRGNSVAHIRALQESHRTGASDAKVMVADRAPEPLQASNRTGVACIEGGAVMTPVATAHAAEPWIPDEVRQDAGQPRRVGTRYRHP